MKKILIAEDDPITQKLVNAIVSKMGLIPFISPNGRHALETLQANGDFSLLITDIMMPEMDGKQLIQAVRNDRHYHEMPVIIMSAFVGVKEISEFLKTGATFFQPKPIDKKKFEEHILKCLERI
ncbi:MAG: response regulator [Thermodesulfobacteriota bacterium]